MAVTYRTSTGTASWFVRSVQDAVAGELVEYLTECVGNEQRLTFGLLDQEQDQTSGSVDDACRIELFGQSLGQFRQNRRR